MNGIREFEVRTPNKRYAGRIKTTDTTIYLSVHDTGLIKKPDRKSYGLRISGLIKKIFEAFKKEKYSLK